MRSIQRVSRRNLILAAVCVIALLPRTLPADVGLHDNKDTPGLRDYAFSGMPLASIIKMISEQDCLSVNFDPSVAAAVENSRASLRIRNSSAARALQILLKEYQLDYEYIGYKTLVVFKGETPKSIKRLDVVMRSISLGAFVQQIAQICGFEISPMEQGHALRKLNLEMRDVSSFRAFEAALSEHGLTYQRVGCDTIMIFYDGSSVVE
ncbi:MAG TPA: STN domain-containing protein [Blastocatellia bacterium]|nr:STN domain-containing protein [Blastocatellia bacterium]